MSALKSGVKLDDLSLLVPVFQLDCVDGWGLDYCVCSTVVGQYVCDFLVVMVTLSCAASPSYIICAHQQDHRGVVRFRFNSLTSLGLIHCRWLGSDPRWENIGPAARRGDKTVPSSGG